MLVFVVPAFDVPFLGFFDTLAIPLLWLVSGKRYVVYYIAMIALFSLPYEIQTIVRLEFLWPTFIHPMLSFLSYSNSLGNNMTARDQAYEGLIANTTLPSQIKSELFMFFQSKAGTTAQAEKVSAIDGLGAIAILIALVAGMVYSVKLMIRDLRMYIQILRRVAVIARGWHR